jgi:predicted nucleotidyltransferase
MAILTRTNALAIATSFVEDFNDRYHFIEEAFLYGSYAYGEPHEYSDLDLLLVISDTADLSRFNLISKLSEVKLSKDAYRDISPKLVSQKGYTLSSLFLESILPKAIRIPIGEQVGVVR